MSFKNLASNLLFCIASIYPSSSNAQVSVSTGWHPWYEVQVDPEDQKDLIICGTKWDARQNAPFGFVYNSRDAGRTWQTALEDHRSAWVTEQSCAFGPKHMAYFVSEAAETKNASFDHELGKSRLFVSVDGGGHWSYGTDTGWADYSTSAVNVSTGTLYLFFNEVTNGTIRSSGASVGLLRFSPDGKTVEGPFVNSEMQRLTYEGVFPSEATALKSGKVVALYWGTRQTLTGREADLGIIRADKSPNAKLDFYPLSHAPIGGDCINFDSGSLAYEAQLDRLYVLYVDGCKETRMMITSSDDEGKTWTKAEPVSDSESPSRRIVNPSLVANAGTLGLLWEDGQGSGRWLFSNIQANVLERPVRELSCGSNQFRVSNDALWTWIYQPGSPNTYQANEPMEPSFTLNVRTELNNVWRGRGLALADGDMIAVWSSGNVDRMHLYSRKLAAFDGLAHGDGNGGLQRSREMDVTAQTALLYGGIQEFDNKTQNLKVCLALENRSGGPIRTPIKIKLDQLESPLGEVSVLSSADEISHRTAIRDISSAVTGSQIPEGMKSNHFCLSFHIGITNPEWPLKGVDLLSVRVKVYSGSGDPSSLSSSTAKR
jgi:hypothetical protein